MFMMVRFMAYWLVGWHASWLTCEQAGRQAIRQGNKVLNLFTQYRVRKNLHETIKDQNLVEICDIKRRLTDEKVQKEEGFE